MMDPKKIERIIEYIRSLKEEVPTNSTGSAIAGLPPDQPPVRTKKPPIIARGLMPGARKRWSNSNGRRI